MKKNSVIEKAKEESARRNALLEKEVPKENVIAINWEEALNTDTR